MGYITNQWLTGYPERRRRFSPIEGAVTASPGNDNWCKRNSVVLEIEVRRSGGNYHQVLLTREEVNKLVPAIVAAADQSVRLKSALATLAGLSDSELFGALASVLNTRAKASEQTAG